jgi:enamine deaminase RidA (YjgF/YER057c/UK114 family)
VTDADADAGAGADAGATAAEGPAGSRPHIQRTNPPGLSPPTGFSHAVTATGSRIVFLAGQTALDTEGAVVGATLTAQFEQALTNLLSALTASGGTPADLTRVTVYTTDVAAYRAEARDLGAVWRRHARRDYPAMALIGVSRLWDEEALVELDGIAVLP